MRVGHAAGVVQGVDPHPNYVAAQRDWDLTKSGGCPQSHLTGAELRRREPDTKDERHEQRSEPDGGGDPL